MADLISKDIYTQRLSWVAVRQVDISTQQPEPGKFIQQLLTGFSHICHLAGLNNTLLSQVSVLGIAPGGGMVGRTDIARMEGAKEPPTAWVQLMGQWWAHPFDDFLP